MRGHGLKYQSVLFPNGMFAGLFGTSASHNDLGVLNMSGLAHYLEDILHPEYTMEGGILPALYGDAIFQSENYSTIVSRFDLVGTEEEIALYRKLNYRMSGVRQSIEHMYGQLFNLLRILKTPRQHQIFRGGNSAYRLGIVCFFILNCYTCFNGSPCNSMFDSTPPTIESYLPLDKDLQPFVENDAVEYDFYVFN